MGVAANERDRACDMIAFTMPYHCLAGLGGADWFRLGDRDLALHVLRSHRLTQRVPQWAPVVLAVSAVAVGAVHGGTLREADDVPPAALRTSLAQPRL